MSNPNRSHSKDIAITTAALVAAGSGMLALRAINMNGQMDKARSAEATALQEIEVGSKNVEVNDFTLILRKGVNVRSQPYLVMQSANDKSDANTAWEVSEETHVTKPLSVRVDTGEGSIPYYLIPKQGEDVQYRVDGKLNPKAFDWVDGRVVGEISSSTGRPYAEIAYPDTSEPELPKGELSITESEVSYVTSTGERLPISQVHKS